MGDIEIRISEWLCQGEDIVLATILASGGSTPRTAGARMAIRVNGVSCGTIGGGRVEAAVILEAKKLFQTRDAVIKTYILNSEAAASAMDMICGGKMTVLIEYVAATRENRDLFSSFKCPPEHPKIPFVIASLGEALEGRIPPLNRMLAGSPESLRHFPLSVLDYLGNKLHGKHPGMTFPVDNRWVLLEPLFTPATVYVFGGGHVSLQTAKFANRVGFKTVVLDDRPEFANQGRFTFADEIRLLKSFEDCFDDLPVDSASYIVIVTRGHLHDKTVLAQALRTSAGYIGMIGSIKKRDAIYSALLGEGFTNADLCRVKCPIGIEIAAETPEEIAVSIVAELIDRRNRKNRA